MPPEDIVIFGDIRYVNTDSYDYKVKSKPEGNRCEEVIASFARGLDGLRLSQVGKTVPMSSFRAKRGIPLAPVAKEGFLASLGMSRPFELGRKRGNCGSPLQRRGFGLGQSGEKSA